MSDEQRKPEDQCTNCGHDYKDHHVTQHYCRKWTSVVDWHWDHSRVFSPIASAEGSDRYAPKLNHENGPVAPPTVKERDDDYAIAVSICDGRVSMSLADYQKLNNFIGELSKQNLRVEAVEGERKPDSAPVADAVPKPGRSDRDWTEDFSHENGNYQNQCIRCDLLFYGHKRRVVCKKCDGVPVGEHKAPDFTPAASESSGTRGIYMQRKSDTAPPDGVGKYKASDEETDAVDSESYEVFPKATSKYKGDLVSFQHGFRLGYEFKNAALLRERDELKAKVEFNRSEWAKVREFLSVDDDVNPGEFFIEALIRKLKTRKETLAEVDQLRKREGELSAALIRVRDFAKEMGAQNQKNADEAKSVPSDMLYSGRVDAYDQIQLLISTEFENLLKP